MPIQNPKKIIQLEAESEEEAARLLKEYTDRGEAVDIKLKGAGTSGDQSGWNVAFMDDKPPQSWEVKSIQAPSVMDEITALVGRGLAAPSAFPGMAAIREIVGDTTKHDVEQVPERVLGLAEQLPLGLQFLAHGLDSGIQAWQGVKRKFGLVVEEDELYNDSLVRERYAEMRQSGHLPFSQSPDERRSTEAGIRTQLRKEGKLKIPVLEDLDKPVHKLIEDELGRSQETIGPFNFMMESMLPQTDAGREITERFDHLFQIALGAVGDTVYEATDSPAVAAFSKGVAAAAPLLFGLKGAGYKTTPADGVAYIKERFPSIYNRMESAGLHAKVGPWDKPSTKAAQTMAADLGLPPDTPMRELSLATLQKYNKLESESPVGLFDSGGTMSPKVMEQLADGFVQQMQFLDNLFDVSLMKNPRAFPVPVPQQKGGSAITVTPDRPVTAVSGGKTQEVGAVPGNAITTEQALHYQKVFMQGLDEGGLGVEGRAAAIGQSQIGQLRAQMNAWQDAKKLHETTPGRGTERAITQNYNKLKNQFAKAFPGANPALRKKVLEEMYIPRNGMVPYHELAQAMGIEKWKAPFNDYMKGVIDIQADELLKTAKNMPELAKKLAFVPMEGPAPGQKILEGPRLRVVETKGSHDFLEGRLFLIYDKRMGPNAEPVGQAILGFEKRGAPMEPTHLDWILVDKKMKGTAEEFIAGILGMKNPTEPLHISAMIPEAQPFWFNTIGVKNMNPGAEYPPGAVSLLDWMTKREPKYRQAMTGRAAEVKSTAQKFAELGELQRGEPEAAMLEVQKTSGGGVLNPVVEHTGDLLHRMTHMAQHGTAFPDIVLDKVNKVLSYLYSRYGFEKERIENNISNAKHRNIEPIELSNQVDKSLIRYSNAFRGLPVYNKAQWLAREAAILVGEKKWELAAQHLRKLKQMVESGKFEEIALKEDPLYSHPPKGRRPPGGDEVLPGLLRKQAGGAVEGELLTGIPSFLKKQAGVIEVEIQPLIESAKKAKKFADWPVYNSDQLKQLGVTPDMLEKYFENATVHQTTRIGQGGIRVGAQKRPMILKKQAGMLEVELPKDLADKAQIIRNMKTVTAGAVNLSVFEQVQKVFDDARKLQESVDQITWNRIVAATKNKVLDHAGELKGLLLKRGGEAGRQAVRDFELQSGASARAKIVYDKRARPIFSDLSKAEENTLGDIVQALRVIQIDTYKGEGKYKHMGGLNKSKAATYLASLREKIGEGQYNRLEGKAREVFALYKDTLKMLYTEGVITKESYKNMINLDYQPRELIDLIDPTVLYNEKGVRISVRDSGVPLLEGGTADLNRMGTRQLLSEALVRAHTRVMRNKAAKALYKLAEDVPDNKIVARVSEKDLKWNDRGDLKTEVHAPQGMTVVYARVDGRQMPMLMNEYLAQQWVTRPHAMHPQVANLVRTLFGVNTVKTLATTYNPAFALTNFPRDIVHSWLATGEYSMFVPMYIGQMGRDLGAVAMDALLKKGRYVDFINEGGGMSYLTHQGRSWWEGGKGGSAKVVGAMHPRLELLKNGLSYLNEFSELWVRLAVRERALRNGKSPIDATWEARHYLDFAQGGILSKSLDHTIPYFNAAIQGFRSVAKQAKKDPLEFTVKAGQLMGATGGLAVANILTNPEAWQQIPTQDKINNLIFTTPMYTVDANGNKRHLYFKVRLDHTVTPLNALVTALVERSEFGKVPDDMTIRTIGAMAQVVPIGSPVPFPSAAAAATYAANYDFWRDDSVWRGAEGLTPGLEYYTYPAEPTPPQYREIGQLLPGISPSRLQAASRAIIPENFYTDMVGASFRYFADATDPYIMSRTTMELLAKSPALKRIVGLTHPAVTEIMEMEREERPFLDQDKLLDDKVAEIVFQEQQGMLPGDGSAMKAWMSTLPPDKVQAVKDRYKNKKIVGEVFRRFEVSEGIPSKVWWEKSARMAPDARAAVFYHQWVQLPTEGRQRMLGIATALHNKGLGYRSESFDKYFKREIQLQGDSQR